MKFEEKGRKLFKLVENTVGKGEIARYKQFLLFSQCFQKACLKKKRLASKGVIVLEWVNMRELEQRRRCLLILHRSIISNVHQKGKLMSVCQMQKKKIFQSNKRLSF